MPEEDGVATFVRCTAAWPAPDSLVQNRVGLADWAFVDWLIQEHAGDDDAVRVINRGG